MPSKMKGGILPFVSRFEEYVNFSEEAFKWAQQTGELEKAHMRLVDTVFNSSEYTGPRSIYEPESQPLGLNQYFRSIC